MFKFLNRRFQHGEVQKRIESFARKRKPVFFLQIGSSDGLIGDPLHKFIKKYKWRGILVEPVPYIFDQLQRNYANCQGLIFENVAIAENEEERDFWYPCQLERPVKEWYHQIGSFSREHVMAHSIAIPDLEKNLVREKVTCISLKSLLEKWNVESFDLLHVDVEGYDFEVIKQVDFSRFNPEIILYEDKHLQPADRAACMMLLRKEGYKLVTELGDTIAFKEM